MGIVAIKSKNKSNKSKAADNKEYAVKLSPKSTEFLRYISDKTSIPQKVIVEKILESMMLVASSLDNFTFDVYPSGSTVCIPFYGRSLIVTGSNDPDITNDEQLFEYMVKKSMGIEPKKEAKETTKEPKNSEVD